MRLLHAALGAVILTQAGLITALVWLQLAPAATVEPTVAVAVTPDAAAVPAAGMPKHLSLIPELSPDVAAKIWPEEERADDVCGTQWQDAYTALHARLVEEGTRRTDARPVRLAVFDCRVGQGGYADRLIGLMTVFLISILTDRALVIHWPGHEDALRSPRLQLTALLQQARSAPSSERRELRWLQGNRLNLAKLTDVPDLNQLWPERVLSFVSNRGFTQHLLRSEHHIRALAERHLTPGNAQFGCLFNFLLRPTAEAMQPFAPLVLAMSDPATYVVGLHVRTGDSAFAPPQAGSAAGGDAGAATATQQQSQQGRSLYEKHKFMFEYAAQLGKRQPLPYRILLLGDSKPLREYAAQLHGPELLLSNTSIGHVARDASALANAVAEHWIFAAADAFAYSSHSGFPRTAAVRAMRTDRIFTCFHYEGPLFSVQQKGQPRPERECSGPYTVFELGDRHAAGL